MTFLPILADRIAGLSGPCRETDADIGIAIGMFSEKHGWPGGGWVSRDEHSAVVAAPTYTGSLDAAMTLVPGGVWYCLSGPHSATGGLYKGGDQHFDMTMGIGDDRSDGKAATAPNAIVAAALRYRARAASEP